MSDHELGEPSQEWDMDHDGDGYLINGVIYVPDTYEEYRADAHLIIAAKDLLERLEAMAAQHRCGCGHPSCNRCEDDRLNDAAIKKARGST